MMSMMTMVMTMITTLMMKKRSMMAMMCDVDVAD